MRWFPSRPLVAAPFCRIPCDNPQPTQLSNITVT
nr:MAG TPA: hypothetical protein [Caudoviricetes sp.]